jgi:hypothetical protein
MKARKFGASIAALALMGTMTMGCASKKDVERADAAATRAEDAARRTEAAASRVDSAAARCEAAANSAGTRGLRK